MPSKSSGRPKLPLVKLRTELAAIVAALVLSSSAWAADFRSVAVPQAVLYDAPSMQANKRYVVDQHYPLEVVVNLGNWIKVRDAAGTVTWIEAAHLTSQRYVLVRTEQAEVRAAADVAAPPLFLAGRDVVLELLEATPPGWAKVRHRDGLSGYIRASDVWGL